MIILSEVISYLSENYSIICYDNRYQNEIKNGYKVKILKKIYDKGFII